MHSLDPDQPKSLLPLLGETILHRLFRQLAPHRLSATLVYVTPSASPRFDRAIPSLYRSHITLVANSSYCDGPISALQSLVHHVATPFCLLLLGDIVYSADPFSALISIVPDPETCLLGCASVPQSAQITRGAVVFDSNGVNLLATPKRPLHGGLAWSGCAFFAAETLRSTLPQFLSDPAAPLETFFMNRFPPGTLKLFLVPPFVNVNSPTDYLRAKLLLSTAQEGIPPERMPQSGDSVDLPSEHNT